LKVYIINSITKSCILNIKIRPLVTEYALMIRLVDGTSSAHLFNPYAYFGHLWSYFDIQNLWLVILYLFVDDVGAIFAERIQHNIAMDMAAKAREDPLFAIRYFMGLL